jgi:hypothetical protein
MRFRVITASGTELRFPDEGAFIAAGAAAPVQNAAAEAGRPVREQPQAPPPDERLNALYVGRHWCPYYQARFDRFVANGGRFEATWNWAAALVPGWLLYRKLWLAAVAWAGLGCVLGAIVGALAILGVDGGMVAVIAGVAMVLVSQGVCGNFLVFSRAQRVIADVVAVRDTAEARGAAVARRGGVAPLAPWLVYAIVLGGLYAAIQYPEFAHPADAAYIDTMKFDLRSLVTAQESYFEDHGFYADSVGIDGSGYVASAGSIVRITEVSRTGWSATIRREPEPPSDDPHLRGTTQTCGIFVGTATPPFAGQEDGVPECR